MAKTEIKNNKKKIDIIKNKTKTLKWKIVELLK